MVNMATTLPSMNTRKELYLNLSSIGQNNTKDFFSAESGARTPSAVWECSVETDSQQSRSQCPQAFLSAVGLLERLWGNRIKYLLFDWLFRLTTYCFAPEILTHFHYTVPESLRATNR